MTNLTVAPFLWGDAFISVSADGVNTATRGDWMLFSGNVVGAADDAEIGSPAYKVSAAGMAASNNPTFDDRGVAVNNSGFIVVLRGVARVSAGASGTAHTIPIGTPCYPDTTASGIVGTTGATGLGPTWITAPPQGISANPTGAIASGVATVIGHPVGGDSGVGQLEIFWNVTTPDYF